jgi:hypothetical protein
MRREFEAALRTPPTGASIARSIVFIILIKSYFRVFLGVP